MKKILLLLGILTLSSCTKNEEDILNSVHYDNFVNLSIKNNLGEDLLDPNHTSTIDLSTIKVFHIINGVKTLFIDNRYTYFKKGFKIYKHDGYGHNIIVIKINPSVTEAKPKTIVEWNSSDEDVIETTYRIKDNLFPVLKEEIWLNDISVWKIADEANSNTTYKFFTLTK